jgi:hypothetical protein
MIERKVVQMEKTLNAAVNTKYWEDDAEMVREFTQLIEYYSLNDVTKAEKYIKLMKELIAKFYNGEGPQPENV